MRGCAVAVVGAACAASHGQTLETITIRSGTGSGGDIRVRAYDNPQGAGPFVGVLGPAEFAAARDGPPAHIISPQAGWVPGVTTDWEAKWIGPTQHHTGLLAADFYVVNTNPSAAGAVLTLAYAASGQLGGGANQGVYLNGHPLSGSTVGGSATSQVIITRSDVGLLLAPGLNTLYLNDTGLVGVNSGVVFSATIRIGQSDGPVWTQHAGAGPGARASAAMVYDRVRSRMVLFGGVPGPTADTWVWDGAAWSRLSTAGPPARSDYSMAYDIARDRVVLFGGYGTGYLGDTWELAGSVWTQVASSGPAARGGAGMVYDSARGRCVMFGGSGGGAALRDTWEWDGASWRQVATDGPPGRAEFGMAYDASRSRTVLYGGSDFFNVLGDTWEWDGTGWLQEADAGPALEPVRTGISMAYDCAGARVVILGGESTDAILPDLWEWRGQVWAPVQGLGPSPRAGYALGYDALRSRLVVFGGAGGTGALGDTWTFGKAASCYANCDGSTAPPVLNINDFICFLNKFSVGCS